MGQSPSSANLAANSNSASRRFLSPAVVSTDSSLKFDGEIGGDGDCTDDIPIPDECLAYIFQFLNAGDRKRCSTVCRRWWRVDGESRHRLSLNAQAEILSSLPSIFTRFNSVTKLALRCDRKCISLNDEGLIMISLRCQNLARLKLRGCREITDLGMAEFAQNCKKLKKLSCGSCTFGAKGMNAVMDHCSSLEELSIKRLRGIDGDDLIKSGAAGTSLKSICLKELVNGQCFEPLVIGSKGLKNLKIIRCLGEWDRVFEMIGKGNGNRFLIEVHLERIQVSDIGLSGISRCVNLEILHIVKTPECTNLGLVSVAENCKQLRKLHIDGWRTRRIGDDGLFSVAKQCQNLQELVLIGVDATYLSMAAIAVHCQKLERLALCGSASIGDNEIACIAEKCMALKKLCIKGCAITDVAIEALAGGCPSLVKVKVRKCRGVSNEKLGWLQGQKASLVVNFDVNEAESLDASTSDGGAQESGVEFTMAGGQVVVAGGPSSSTGRLSLFRAKLGLFASRNIVACAFNRWSNSDDSPNSNL